MQQLDNRHQHGGHRRTILSGVVADHLPAGRGSERRTLWEHAPPGFRQGVQRSAGRRGQRDKAAQSCLRQAPQQDVGQRGGGLALAREQRWPAMGEMQRQVGVGHRRLDDVVEGGR